MLQRILVVKLADLGDLLTTTPALRALRLSFPDARLDVLAAPSGSGVLDGSDLVDRLITFDKFAYDQPSTAIASLKPALTLGRRLRAQHYDAVLLFHHLTTAYGIAKYAALVLATGARIRAGLDNGRGPFLTHRAPDRGFGEQHEADYWLAVARTIGAVNPRPRLEMAIPAAAEAAAGRAWTALGLGGEQVALLHPGSGRFSLARRWPADRYSEVGDRLVDSMALRVAVLAGPAPGEAELARRVIHHMRHPATLIEGVPSPAQLAATVRRAQLFVGNDSGVMHIAAAVETPVVAIFGPTNHRAWGPYPPSSPKNLVVREPVACSPCIHRGHSFGTPAGCPARTCLDLIGVEPVILAARQLLPAA